MYDTRKIKRLLHYLFIFTLFFVLVRPSWAQEKPPITDPPVKQEDPVTDRPIKTATWEGKPIEYFAGVVTVKLASGKTRGDLKPLLEKHGAELALTRSELEKKVNRRSSMSVEGKQKLIERIWDFPFVEIKVPPQRDIFPLIDSLKQSPLIEEAQPTAVARVNSPTGVPSSEESKDTTGEKERDGAGQFSVDQDSDLGDDVSANRSPASVSTPLLTPNDPYFAGTSPATFNHQWGLDYPGLGTPPDGESNAHIRALSAWNFETGNSDIVIAVLDSGIPLEDGIGPGVGDQTDLSHPDLDESAFKIELEMDWTGDGQGLRDNHGHGTHVAGIAAAETDNGEGIAGVCWECGLLIIQVADEDGAGNANRLCQGIINAVTWKDDVNPNYPMVINMSVGVTQNASTLRQCLNQYTQRDDVLIVAGVGKDGDPAIRYPAAFADTTDNLIAVAATNHNNDPANYFPTGPQITVAAPGGEGLDFSGDSFDEDDIFSTTPTYSFTIQTEFGTNQTYGYMAGTSMATPFVSGTAGLMWSMDPTYTAAQIKETLKQTADECWGTPQGPDNECGHGRIDAAGAVASVGQPDAPYHLEVANAGQYGAAAELAWDAVDEAESYRVYRCSGSPPCTPYDQVGSTSQTSYITNVILRSSSDPDAQPYSFHVRAVANNLLSDPSDEVTANGDDLSPQPSIAGPGSEASLRPTEFALEDNAPNPVRQATTIRYALPEAAAVSLTVYDAMGREVDRLVDGVKPAGFHEVQFDASELSSGIYIYRLTAGTFTETRRMVVVR